MSNLKKILLDLVQLNTAKEISDHLDTDEFFKTVEWWPIGNNESNFSIVSAQQADPLNALVEKIVNSIDALLMLECLAKGIKPDDTLKAPHTMKQAVEEFFYIPDADLSKLSLQKRLKIAEKITIIAQGSKESPSLTILDSGEGQLPQDFPNTFLSLPTSKGNKLNIGFVQGKFNMGGTGALMFCGDSLGQRYQLVLSRRNSRIANNSPWGFTLVRENIQKGFKMPIFEYMCDKNGDILSFPGEPLPILPQNEIFSEGSFIKLYNYDLPNPSNINLDLWRDLNRKLYSPALPFRTYETRFESKDIHGLTRTVVGNAFRVTQENQKWVEELYQIRSDLGKFGNRIIEIVLFKDIIEKKIKGEEKIRALGNSEFTTPSEAVFLTVNGQTHHTIGRSIIKTKANLKNLADYLMIHIDVSNLEAEANEIFHGSREQVRKNKIYRDFESRLLSDLRDNPFLKSWDEEYRKRKMARAQPDIHFVKRTASKILGKNPDWAKKLNLGQGVSINVPRGTQLIPFRGSYIPTFLKLRGDSVKKVPINNKYSWIYLETDAQNDYLTREKNKGRLEIDISPKADKSYWLTNGLISLKVITPNDIKMGEQLEVSITLTRPKDDSFHKKLKIVYIEPKKKSKGDSIKRKPSKEEYNLPDLDRIYKERWNELGWSGSDIALVDGSIIRINADAHDLQEFLKQYEKKFKAESIHKAYETAIYLYTFILDNELENREDKDEIIPKIMKGISKIVLPLNFEDILEEFD